MGIEDTDATIRDCCVEDIERVLSRETSGQAARRRTMSTM